MISKLRQYMSGLLLLLLAGFIMASISYITSMVPEVTLSPGDAVTSIYTELILSRTVSVSANTGYTAYLNPVTLDHNKYQYIVAVKSPVNVSTITSISYNEIYLSPRRYNDTVGYIVVPNTVTNVSAVGFRVNWGGTYSLYFIKADKNADTNNALRAFFYKLESNTTTTIPAPTISNKLILNFIGWISGIVLVLEALRRFDLEI